MRFCFLIIIIAISACSTPQYLKFDKLRFCKIDEEYKYYAGANSRLGVKYHSVHELGEYNDDGNEYKFLLYETLVFSTGSTYSDYTFIALLFKNNKLLFFGFPEDFMKNESDIINKFGYDICSIIKTEMR